MEDVPPEVIGHYERFDERSRLTAGEGLLEWSRTLDILERHLPPPPGRILDVGGGPGRYARHFGAAGYDVHLVDPVPRHVDQAAGAGLAGAELGDARHLDHGDESFDAVLLMGPLYHLQSAADRLQALAEARRVLRPGGVVAAAAIGRFASALDGLDRALVDDPRFREILAGDLHDGRHRNPTGEIEYFTTAYLHHPDDLLREIGTAGFEDVTVLAVEGIGWVAGDLEERHRDPARWDFLLGLLRSLEREPSLLGASPHLLAIAHR
jgi:SAM-dependent methyltransferase